MQAFIINGGWLINDGYNSMFGATNCKMQVSSRLQMPVLFSLFLISHRSWDGDGSLL